MTTTHTGALLVEGSRPGSLVVLRCDWEIVTGQNPEPDGPSNAWFYGTCGAVIRVVDGNEDHLRCDGGHEHIVYGSPTYQAMEPELAERERRDAEEFEAWGAYGPNDISFVC
jgi:hypothetical protein